MPIARCARGSPGTAIGHDAASIEIAAELDVEWLCPVVARVPRPIGKRQKVAATPIGALLTGELADIRSRWHTRGLSRQMPRYGGGTAVANPSQTAQIPSIQANSNRSPRLVSDPEHQRIRAKTTENAEARGSGFTAFRGCSEDSGTQRDRRERLAVRFAVRSEGGPPPGKAPKISRHALSAVLPVLCDRLRDSIRSPFALQNG